MLQTLKSTAFIFSVILSSLAVRSSVYIVITEEKTDLQHMVLYCSCVPSQSPRKLEASTSVTLSLEAWANSLRDRNWLKQTSCASLQALLFPPCLPRTFWYPTCAPLKKKFTGNLSNLDWALDFSAPPSFPALFFRSFSGWARVPRGRHLRRKWTGGNICRFISAFLTDITGYTLTTRDCKGPQTNMPKNVGSIMTWSAKIIMQTY